LHDISAELGPMRFVDRSHRDGSLGSVLNDDYASNETYRDLLDVYPKLAERLTPPMEYAIGDATAHDGYTAHGTLPNTTDRPRISHISSYAPAGTRWWNGTIHNSGAERVPLDDEGHPIVYPRRG
jgi:ectoine hydroxylase-related dioxygenase (phytanoyl-CoA dioxygenase family)